MVRAAGAWKSACMVRLPRPDIAGVPQHVVQRGNNRLPCFLDDEDRQRYLQCLKEALLRYGCALHAYVLMSNHAHLLLTPPEAGVLPRMMQTFARNYVGLFNDRHGRQVRSGRGATSLVWWIPNTTCWCARDTSNSTRYALGWWVIHWSILGPATRPTP